MPKRRNNATVVVLISCGLRTSARRPHLRLCRLKPGAEGTLSSLMRAGKVRWKIDDAQVDLATVQLSGVDSDGVRFTGGPDLRPEMAGRSAFRYSGQTTGRSFKEKTFRLMLRTMLADRFKMTAHHEQKIMAVYALVAGREYSNTENRPPRNRLWAGCTGPPGHRICQKMSMRDLAAMLSGYRANDGDPGSIWLDRPVVDKTGLEGVLGFPI